MTGWVKRAGFAFLLTGVLGFTASPVRGQDRETECRCVDRDGSEIENCICVRTPRMDRLVRGALMTGAARPRLGITVEVSESTSTRGARISGVMEEGPAEQAGLAEGDVITSVDGQPLSQPLAAEHERDLDPVEPLPAQRLLALVRQLEPVDRVEIEYLGDGESRRPTGEAEDLGGWGRTFAFEAPGWDAEAPGERMRSLSEQMRHLRAPRAPDAPRAPAPRAFRFELDRPEAPGAWFGFGPTAAFGLEMAPLTPDCWLTRAPPLRNPVAIPNRPAMTQTINQTPLRGGPGRSTRGRWAAGRAGRSGVRRSPRPPARHPRHRVPYSPCAG